MRYNPKLDKFLNSSTLSASIFLLSGGYKTYRDYKTADTKYKKRYLIKDSVVLSGAAAGLLINRTAANKIRQSHTYEKAVTRISQKINENNGVLEIAIEHIANMDVDNLDYDNNTEIFDINNKILYNNLKHNKIYIDEYKVYYGKIDAIYKELENFNSFKKTKLLRKIRQFYIDEIKENYNGTNDINIIRENSDNIFDNVKERIENCLSNVEEDDVYIALPIILVDAFIRCKILEEPK